MNLRRRSYLTEEVRVPFEFAQFAKLLGFDRDLKPLPFKPYLYQCPKCHGETAYKKEFHPDTGYDEVLGYCPQCRHKGDTGFVPV